MGGSAVVAYDNHHEQGGTMSTHTEGDVRKAVRERYARAAKEDAGCCEPSCCGDESGPDGPSGKGASRAIGYSGEDLAAIPEEADLGLGCGNPTAVASLAPGETVLDLGSGAGIDCFLAAREVGPSGRVIGVDMTPEMIERARANAATGGYENVEFRLGEIEALPVADASVDVIISNCVLNLSPAKERVLAEAFRVLKPGGRVMVSDLVSDRAVPEALAADLDAVAGCLPTQRQRYLDQFRAAGFRDVTIRDEKPYPAGYIMDDPGVRRHLEGHPEQGDELQAFAHSIAGAHFEARKPDRSA
jgi:arsenite methyltransferase